MLERCGKVLDPDYEFSADQHGDVLDLWSG